ncbi:hypothetical protein [Tessaracoccus coleopterorum]|uniref:hypothetical protein n=1 Tax=Tessaracoccus coleopterorum TaxID=2714950 RepID=UPI001E3293C0|nr:hypothetical protein [Tessaracoccus coleopterorum]
MIKIANAPVSYGVFGLARPDLVALPTGEELLALVRGAGYDGIDLGAHGLFGTGSDLVDALDRHGLGLAGGWLDYPFTGTDEQFEAAFAAALPVLDDFALVAATQEGPGPSPPSPTPATMPARHGPAAPPSCSCPARPGTSSSPGSSGSPPMSGRWAWSPPSTTTPSPTSRRPPRSTPSCATRAWA